MILWAGIAALCLFLPGYPISRYLRSPFVLGSSFCISLLVLFYSVFLLGLLGFSIQFESVLLPIVAITLFGGIMLIRREGKLHVSFRSLALVPTLLLLLLAALVSVLCYLNPLFGPDVHFRWVYLAEEVLRLKHWGFYPPILPHEFRHYFFLDGIPPLVSFTYWWCFAAVGDSALESTLVFVASQYLLSGVFVYLIAEKLHSTKAAYIAAFLLVSSPLFLWSTTMGHETGLTALSLLGMIYFLVVARDPSQERSATILAGLMAALGIISREYCWAYLVCGAIACAWLSLSPRSILRYLLIGIVFGAPWYIFVWWKTGHPLYGIQLPGPFELNPVFSAVLQKKVSILGFGTDPVGKTTYFLTRLFAYQATGPMLLGLLGSIWYFRKQGYLVLCVIVIFALGVNYVGYVNAPWFAPRILSPAIGVLAILGGMAAVDLTERLRHLKGVGPIISGFLLLLGVHFLLQAFIIYPSPPKLLRTSDLFSQEKPSAKDAEATNYVNTKKLSFAELLKSNLPGGGKILSSNPAFWQTIRRLKLPFEAVPIWSPEVRFVFDEELTGREVRERLLTEGFVGVSYYPNYTPTPYLNSFKLYEEDRSNWKALFDSPDLKVYRLPF